MQKEIEELIEQREKVFLDVFPEFAFLTLRQYEPQILVELLEALVHRDGAYIGLIDPYRLHRALLAGARRYVASGQAEKFYAKGESRLLENLSVCLACQNGEHERCYIDGAKGQAKGSFCGCPCSKAMAEVRSAGTQLNRIRRAFRRVFPAPEEE